MSITLNGKTITITEYATLIIETARKIIEREQTAVIQSINGYSTDNVMMLQTETITQDVTIQESKSKDGTPVDPQSREETPSGNCIPSAPSTDSAGMGSVMIRLPDGSIQTVEEYIITIIKDASAQIQEDHTGLLENYAEIKKDNPNAALEITPEATAEEKDCNSCKKQKSGKIKRTSSVSKVFNRIFNRGKSKESTTKEEKTQEEKTETSNLDGDTCRNTQEETIPSKDPENTTPAVETMEEPEDTKAEIECDQNDQTAKEKEDLKKAADNKEIPSRKQNKKRNSFRKMLSCFSSKSAQLD